MTLQVEKVRAPSWNIPLSSGICTNLEPLVPRTSCGSPPETPYTHSPIRLNHLMYTAQTTTGAFATKPFTSPGTLSSNNPKFGKNQHSHQERNTNMNQDLRGPEELSWGGFAFRASWDSLREPHSLGFFLLAPFPSRNGNRITLGSRLGFRVRV